MSSQNNFMSFFSDSYKFSIRLIFINFINPITFEYMKRLFNFSVDMGAEQSTAGEYWTGEKINENWSKWMQGIPDSESLKDISIPGTHNSMSFYGGPLVRCQSMSLYNQYVAGIRFVDIRCRHFYNGLPIHHGIVFQNATLDHVLRQTSDFLSANPTETVILSLRDEHISEHNNRSYEETLQNYIMKYPEKLFYTENRIFTSPSVVGSVVAPISTSPSVVGSVVAPISTSPSVVGSVVAPISTSPSVVGSVLAPISTSPSVVGSVVAPISTSPSVVGSVVAPISTSPSVVGSVVAPISTSPSVVGSVVAPIPMQLLTG